MQDSPQKPSRKLTPEEVEFYKRQEVELLEEKLKTIEGLPHLHAWKWYSWAKKVFDSYNREIFVTAANQISKSSTAIRKNIEWACNPEIWKQAFPLIPPGQKPNQFWYFYPTLDVATIEFETKWVPLFLPKGKYKDHPLYGWKEYYEKSQINCIVFNSGVTIYFKSYEQKVSNLQTGTCFLITLDEECPVDLLPEIQARLNSSDGYLLSVFTATLGQLYWEKTMEPKTKDEELHPDALKMQVSVFDCQTYEDGTLSHWTPDKIQRAIKRCSSESEVQRRIYGKFVRSEGLRFYAFERARDVVKAHPLPRHWHIYGGVDPGSGGTSGHPTGILFLAVSPDFKQGRVFKAWRGDRISTTNQDSLNKFKELRGNMKCVLQIYDNAARDFYLVASKQGEAFTPCQKNREGGMELVNTLFRSEMLKIQDGDGEIEKLIGELSSLSTSSNKQHRGVVDDLSDVLRYIVELVPWDFSGIQVRSDGEDSILAEEPPEPTLSAADLRRDWFMDKQKVTDEIEDELDYWNDLAGS